MLRFQSALGLASRFMGPDTTVIPLFARTATMATIHILVPPTATTVRHGSAAASSLAQARGITTVMDTAATMAIEAVTMAGRCTDTLATVMGVIMERPRLEADSPVVVDSTAT